MGAAYLSISVRDSGCTRALHSLGTGSSRQRASGGLGSRTKNNQYTLSPRLYQALDICSKRAYLSIQDPQPVNQIQNHLGIVVDFLVGNH